MSYKPFDNWTFLRSGLRRLWLKHPSRHEALKASRHVYKGDNKRQIWEYTCAICAQPFKASEVQVDHIKPCGKLTAKSHITNFILNLFCSVDNLQILCKPCHKAKTKSDLK